MQLLGDPLFPGRPLSSRPFHPEMSSTCSLSSSSSSSLPFVKRKQDMTSSIFGTIIKCLLLIVFLSRGVSGVKLTQLQVPDLVYRGESVWFNCTYDLENEPLYSIKWFKRNNEVKEEGVWSEFYRFIPNDDEVKKWYPMKGVKVDLERSSLGNVYLMNVDVDTEGTYKCEVSADAPSFETVREERDTRIYYFAPNQPTIKGLKSQYGIGEYVDATCSINFARPQFKPMTSLAWFINGEAAPIGYLRGRSARRRLFSSVAGYPGSPFKSPSTDSDDDESNEDPSLYSPFEDSHSSPNGISNVKTLSIKFLVNPKHFINGVMKIKCVASSIPEAFSRTHEEVILAETSRGTSFPGRYSSYSLSVTKTSKCYPCLLLTLLIMSILVSRCHLESRLS